MFDGSSADAMQEGVSSINSSQLITAEKSSRNRTEQTEFSACRDVINTIMLHRACVQDGKCDNDYNIVQIISENELILENIHIS